MIIVWGAIEAKPEHKSEVERLGLAHTQRSRLEPGCLLHSIQVDVENDCRFVFYEQWADKAALDAHFRVPESNEFVKAVSKLAAKPAEMQIFAAEKA